MKKTVLSKQSKTDWARIDAMQDEDIDYSDISPLTEEFFKNAVVRWPCEKDWFQVQNNPKKAMA